MPTDVILFSSIGASVGLLSVHPFAPQRQSFSPLWETPSSLESHWLHVRLVKCARTERLVSDSAIQTPEDEVAGGGIVGVDEVEIEAAAEAAMEGKFMAARRSPDCRLYGVSRYNCGAPLAVIATVTSLFRPRCSSSPLCIALVAWNIGVAVVATSSSERRRGGGLLPLRARDFERDRSRNRPKKDFEVFNVVVDCSSGGDRVGAGPSRNA